MSALSKQNSFLKIVFAVMFALAAVDVVRGKFPVQPVSFLIGYLLGPLVWPRFYRIKSTVWSFLGLLLLGVAAFVASVAIGVMLKPFGEQASQYYFDGWQGFFLGLCSRVSIGNSSSKLPA